MKPFCQFCKAEGHWGNQCPKLKAIAHTLNQATKTPRVVTHQIVGAGEHVPSNITRRPIAWGPKPKALNQGTNTTPAAYTLKSVDHPVENLHEEIKHLKRELATRAKRIAELEARLAVTNPVTVTTDVTNNKVTAKRGPRKSGNALTPAEKQRAYRARKKSPPPP